MGEAAGSPGNDYIIRASRPTVSAQRFGTLDETMFAEFDATTSTTSLEVTIDPGEAFVDGWLARDEETTVTLDADTAGQEVVLGWDPDAVYDEGTDNSRDDADEVLLDTRSNIEDMAQVKPYTVIWEFDTDEDGVTSTDDLRYIGPVASVGTERVATLDDLPSADEYPLGTRFFVLDENQSYEVVQDE